MKSKYPEWGTPEGLIKVQGWARDGLLETQIAAKMGISVATLNNYKNEHVEFLEAIKSGKDIPDRKVENSLLKRALGYEYVETTREPCRDEDGVVSMKVTKEVTKQVVADTTAQIFWLKNRKPEAWRDKRDIELSGKVNLSDTLKEARERVLNAETK